MRYKDGRFAQHPQWRYVTFNSNMRHQVTTRSSYFVKQVMTEEIDLDELRQAIVQPNDQQSKSILSRITRYAGSFRGTRPFWSKKRHELTAMIRQIETPDAFITFSAADLQWESLASHMPRYEEWKVASDADRVRIARQNLIDNPHIATWHFDRRHKALKEQVLTPKFGITDSWERKEYQARGSDHSHGFIWASNLLTALTAENQKQWANDWGIHVTAINPDPLRTTAPVDERSALQFSSSQSINNVDQLNNIVNRTLIHTCSPYCLRRLKGAPEGAPKQCRFHYPRLVNIDDVIDPPPRLNNTWNEKYSSFEAVRNTPNILPYNRLVSMA